MPAIAATLVLAALLGAVNGLLVAVLRFPALIATLAVFRMLLGYGSIWLDVVLIALGAITFLLPTFMHMRWNAHYNMGHMVGGGIVVAVAVISLLITIPVNNRMRHA